MIDIIPAIDIIDGKCVRLENGDFSRNKTYFKNPVEVAKRFSDAGYQRLHIVDLDGVRAGKPQHLRILQEISTQTNLKIDFSGGIRNMQDVKDVFGSGARWIILGSLAVKNPDLTLRIVNDSTPGTIILGADTLMGKVVCSGWVEQSNISIIDFISFWSKAGISQVMCTDVEKDGLMKGPAVDLYKKLVTKFPEIQLIASGGVSSMDDISVLESCGIQSAIVGKAFYEKLNGFKF